MKHNNCYYFVEYTNFIDDSVECKCLCSKKNYEESLIKT